MRLIEELKLLGAFDKAELSPSAKKHKKEYDTKYESTPARKKYRRDLERERRKRGVDGKGGKDMSHTARGTIVPEDMHANRARHFKERGTLKKNLNRWFKEKWVDVSRKNKDGSHPPCGRSKASKSKRGYPKCRPSVKVSSKTPKTAGSMSEGQKRAATKRKRSKRQGVGGKPTIVKARRIPRKKGQPANSKKHSDLYTDENPKGTIHGLGFKNTAKAKQSVVKIKNSSRTHAHKTQAAIAMEQRAREMGKKKEAGVYRNFIEEQKKKTEEMKKAFPAKYAGNCRECGTYLAQGELVNYSNRLGGIVCRRSPGCGMVYVR